MSSAPDSMDCRSVREVLSDYLDDQLAPDRQRPIHVHLHACPGCAAALADLLATVRALRALPRVHPPADPWPALVFVLRREGLLVPWYRQRRTWRAGVAAAGIVAAVWVYQATRPQPAANLEAYWREHAIYTSQEEPTGGGPALEAIEATYQLQGSDR